ncbi:MAG TPA: hypothetical protein VFJ85_12465 [Acidimicrobiales bacterium]|nr:hypothetical protein [Acidimicrobiales bacterium]
MRPAVHAFNPLRRPWLLAFAGVLLAIAVFGRPTSDVSGATKASIPFPSLTYDIEATSGTHTASILNLGIGYLSTLQAPMPVDVDGDLLPDVTVAVNLVSTPGLHNPPQAGDIIIPNVTINRFPLELGTTLLGRPSPPLKIDVVFKVYDLQGQTPTMTTRFGYDTGNGGQPGSGGSIPGYFQATLKGIESFFNPMTATISTKGAVITQDSTPLWYQGPLSIIGGFQQGAFNADLNLNYSPFPDTVSVTYGHDTTGDHIDYSHGNDGEVNLLTKAVVQDNNKRIDVAARIDRLPKTLGLDLGNVADGGAVHFDTSADGRLPDVDVRYKGPLLGDVFDAHLAIEDLPTTMDATWSLPSNGPVTASFDSSGQGIGAVEATIQNKNGAPTGLPAFVFPEKQVAAAQLNTATGGTRVGARLERIRHADLTATRAGNVDANINIGDGELPLHLAGFADLRSTGGPLVNANSTISPLPGSIGLSLRPAGSNQQTDPLKVIYTASEAVDVDASVLVQQPTAASGLCGATGVICGDLRLRHIPQRIETRIGTFTNAENKQETRIETDTQGPGHVDVFADAKVGPNVIDAPLSAGKPLVARLEMQGITKNVRVRTIEGQDNTLQRTEFHACPFDYAADACPAGTATDQIGSLQFAVANFLPTNRPTDLPPAYAATPNFATITARGRDNGTSVDFEATGRVASIRELTYVNQGAFGYRSDIGGGGDLATLVDVDNIAFGPGGAGQPLFDVTGNVLIHPLPQRMSFCLNAPGQAIVSPVSSITAPCQDKNPFSTDANRPALAKSPLSVSYDGKDGSGNPQEFNVDADGELLAHNGAGTDDDRRIRGTLDIDHVPATVRAHVLDSAGQPAGTPFRVLVEAPTLGPQLTVSAKASLLDGDLQCEDPRVPKRIDSTRTQMAVCAQGRVENVPNRLTLDYDQAAPTDNFVLDSTGEKRLNLTGLRLSSVTRSETPNQPARASVLVATGQVLGLPYRVEGTLHTPAPGKPDDPVLIDLKGTPSLVDQIDANVRNFIAPDPIPSMPAQRQGLADPKALVGGKPVGDWASFIQRGDAFEGDLHVSSINRVGFKNQVDADGKRLDTAVVNVDFGKDKVVRGYVDLDKDGTDRLIGDVTLSDIPAGIQVCVRPPTTRTNAPAAGTATFCDTTPSALPDRKTEGAFEARMSSDVGAKLDVDAFVRSAKAGGVDLLAGRLTIDNIPNVVRGTFGGGTADIGGFTLAGRPDGIDRIATHVASFDLLDDGWGSPNSPARPYAPRFVQRAPFPVPDPVHQNVGVRADDTDFELRARIGEANDGGAASDLHRVSLSTKPCARPSVGPDYGNGPADYGPRPDFPLLRTDDGTTHTCIRADFKPDGVGDDPLDLSVVVNKGGQTLAVHDAGITDIPAFFQLNLADADPLQTPAADDPHPHRLRPTCVGTGFTQPANCVSPFVRMDTPGNSKVFGVVEVGRSPDIAAINAVIPRDTLPAYVAPFSAAGTDQWGGVDGVRARVGQYADRSVIAGAFRLLIPASLTVDQVGSWGESHNDANNFWDASDLHFRYAARQPNGDSINNLGEMSALIHSFVDGGQILIADDDPTHGIQIPGELGLDVYMRDFSGKGRTFIQIDGRTSAQDLDAGARIFGGASEDSITRIDAQIRNVPALPSLAYDPPGSALPNDDPTFRIRAEIMGDPKSPPNPDGNSDTGGDPPKEDECSPLLCVQTQVRMDRVNAQFDFRPGGQQPGDPPPARLIEAAIRTAGAENGVEMRGYDSIDAGNPNDSIPDNPAAFLAGAQLSIDPINIFVHAGIPLLGSLDFIMQSNLKAAASLGGDFQGFSSPVPGDPTQDVWNNAVFGAAPKLVGRGTSSFQLRQNLVKIDLKNGGPGPSRLGPVDLHVNVMHGEAWALFVKLIGIDFVPPDSDLRIPFLDCDALGLFPAGANSLQVQTSRSAVAWPFFPAPVGNLHYSGLLAPVLDLVGSFAGPFFCLVSTDDLELMEANGAKVHPADPLGIARTFSEVPGAVANAEDPAPISPPTPDDGKLVDWTAPAGTLSMCGTFSVNSATIPVGSTVKVGTVGNDTLDIRGMPDVAKDDFPLACPSGAEKGKLEIIAAGDVTVNGTIDGNAIQTSDPGGTAPVANGGGGHGRTCFLFCFQGDGGTGSAGASSPGGTRYGDSTNAFTTEAGQPGGAGDGTRGLGGATVKVVADTLRLNGGKIVVNGGNGQNIGSTSDCFVAATDSDPGHPNTGKSGGGAGAGGGLVIAVASYENAGGTVSANGGKGGDGSRGGGGGGAGGNVKVTTALTSGALPTSTGGSGGADKCGTTADDPGVAGGKGDDVTVQLDQAPRSKVDISGAGLSFWNSTQGSKSLTLPYQAAAQPSSSNDYSVELCHTRRQLAFDDSTNPQQLDLGQQLLPGTLSAPVLYDNNGGVVVVNPFTLSANPGPRCGTMDVTSTVKVGVPDVLGSQFITNASRNNATFVLDSLADGYHGFWTVVWKSTVDGNDCLNPLDMKSGGGTPTFQAEGAQFDQSTCTPEAQPATPDAVLGVDNQDPNIYGVTINGTAVTDPSTGAPIDGDTTTPGFQPVVVNTSSPDLQVTWTDNDNFVSTPDANSGVNVRRCSPDASTEDPSFDCTPGQKVTVSSGDGLKTVRVRVFDAAGNTDAVDAQVRLDTTRPISSGAAVPGTAVALQNGWTKTSPQFDLSGFNDFGGSGPADPPYEYQFDDALVHPCPVDILPATCRIGNDAGEDLPGIGRHTLRWAAVDKVGNKYAGNARPSIAVKIDGAEPISALNSVPASPNGANGWYSGPTWVTFGAFDQPGASGFTKASDDAVQIGGIRYTITKDGVTSPPTVFDIANPVAVRLQPGTSKVCWQVTDQAGNTDVADLVTQCRTFLVDEADPVTTLPTNPNTPDGAAGWWVTNPLVNPTVNDGGLAGSGVGNDTAGVCGQNPTVANPAPSGTCVSVDGSPFVPVVQAKYVLSLGEGQHEVRSFATDVAGRRSAIATRLYNVDLSNPVAAARTIMPRASTGKWWRSVPTVVLRAADGDRHNAGVARVRYQFSGTTAVAPCTAAPCVYNAPFDVPQGVERVTYWAEDNAGRSQAPQVLKVAVDTTPPVPKATSPNPAIWLRSKLGLPLTSPTVDLNWTLQENLSGITSPDNNPPDKVNVKVVVYDVQGYPVRTLNAGDYTVAPGQTLSGKAVWDGKGANLTSLLPLGTYYYRVVATDAAGNVAMSGESSPLTIKLSLL